MSKALLFGINYTTSPESSLRGCVQDVKNMADTLKNVFKFEDVEIHTDEHNDSAVNKNAIIDTLIRAMHECYSKKIKHLWVHFSGHGSQVRDVDGDEKDGLDECFIPADYKLTGVLRDDDFVNIFNNFPKYTKIFCVFDCCHSGTMLDLCYEYELNSLNHVFKTEKYFKYNNCTPSIVMISGCRDTQTSADAYNVMLKHTFTGALTSCILLIIQSYGISVSIESLFSRVSKLLKEKKFDQKPLLSSSFPLKNTLLCDFTTDFVISL
jgi:hypothetical protein